MTMYRNHLQILKEWPSLADLARDLDMPYATVRNWSRPERAEIPHKYWRNLIKVGKKRGISLGADDFI